MIIKDHARLRALFKEKGLAVTDQRLAVYAALTGSKAHPSAEAVYKTLKPSRPSLSLATVYKTMQALLDRGLISLVNAPHTEARYDAVTGVHHHLICTKCGGIEDLFSPELDRLRAPGAKGFKIETHSVHFRGLCRACQDRCKDKSRRRNNTHV